MKIILAPDKFKGSLTSEEVCKAIEAGIVSAGTKDVQLLHFPMADGGDGFNIVLQHYFNTAMVTTTTTDPLGRPVNASYQWDDASKLAIIEMATASGLVLLKTEERNPLYTSTYGTGLLIKDALLRGAKKIILGLGGSATNDAGTGILAALGFSFTDETGKALEPVGASLGLINRIIPPERLPDVSFDIAADVDNPLFGEKGAAFVYGPQKGADREEVIELDNGLRKFAALVKRQQDIDVGSFAGSGAAGGVAAGLRAFFPVHMKRGVDVVVDANQLEKQLPGTQLVITGEGRIDDQSGSGKVVGTVAALAAKYHIPCIAFCGLLDADEKALQGLRIKAAYSIADASKSSEENMRQGGSLLMHKVVEVFGSFK